MKRRSSEIRASIFELEAAFKGFLRGMLDQQAGGQYVERFSISISDITMIMVIVLIIYIVAIEPFIARRKGNRSVFNRLIGTLLIGGPKFHEKKDVDREDGLGDAILAVAAAVIAFQALKRTYLFLKDVEWNSLSENDREAISRFSVDVERIRDNSERLRRSEQLVASGDRYSIEQGALLASAALEAGLKQLQRKNGFTLTSEQSTGIVGLVTALRDRGLISTQEYSDARRFVSVVRNKVAHGDFQEFDHTVANDEIRFVRNFFLAHSLS